MKLVLFVEGQTERALPAFFKRWLDTRIPRPVGVRTVRFTGWRDYYDEIATKVELFRALPPEQAVEKCPHLKVLLNEMLQLVQSEG